MSSPEIGRKLNREKTDEALLDDCIVHFIATPPHLKDPPPIKPGEPREPGWRSLGSGFIIGCHENLIFVLTAAHVLTDAADFVLGNNPAAARGANYWIDREAEFNRRCAPLLLNHVSCCLWVNGSPQMARLIGMEFQFETPIDIALLCIEKPNTSGDTDYIKVRALAVDFDPFFVPDQPLYCVGVPGDSVGLVRCEVKHGHPGIMVVVHGHSTYISEGRLLYPLQIRDNVNLEIQCAVNGGVSGGPVLVRRPVYSGEHEVSRKLTAVAVVSKGLDDRTIIVPTRYAAPLHVMDPTRKEFVRMADAIRLGWIHAHGYHAPRTSIRRTIDGRLWVNYSRRGPRV